MRPKHVLLLSALAAVPVLLALLLIGGENAAAPRRATGVAPAQVSLELLGSSRKASATACGIRHNYQLYPGTGTIVFRGTISRPAHWKVTVKLKSCFGGAFQSAGDARGAVSTSGSFTGSFPTPIGGDYFARVELKLNGQLVAHSTKDYFEVR